MLNLDVRAQRAVAASVPARRYLAQIRSRREAPIQGAAVAVSVFDAWLGPERYHELDCDPVERSRRNTRHNDLCMALRQQYEVFAVRRRGRRANRRLVFRQFLSTEEFQGYIDANDMTRTADQFFVLAVPSLGLIYEQHWDDTNIAWFNQAHGVERLRELATQAGLHPLSLDR